MKRRDFGNTRQLSSGKWQARYTDPGGKVHAKTFESRKLAAAFLSTVQTDTTRGEWRDPDAGRVTFETYASGWLASRGDLKVTTRELYRWVLTKYLLPYWGGYPVAEITPIRVRAWYGDMLENSKPTPTGQSYRLLRGILNSAVDDDILLRNPCRIKNGGAGKHPERVPATIEQVNQLADSIDPRYRLLVLTAAWTGARWGELAALTRDRLDLVDGRMTIDRQFVTVRGSGPVLDTPKTAAGHRVIHVPPHLLPDLRHHLAEFVPAGCPYVFPNRKGEPVRRPSFEIVWRRAREKAGMPSFRFHDLRHTGNTLAAQTGASTRELMARMGHASMRAALIYQHSSSDRDKAIAEALSRAAAGQAASVRTGDVIPFRPRAV